MRLIDYANIVIHTVKTRGEIKQTDLTEAVWGTSGRGNKSLTDTLFPVMVTRKWLVMTQRGRSKVFSLGPKGDEYLAQNPVPADWLESKVDLV